MSKNKEEQIRQLYEDAIIWHLIHEGKKSDRDAVRLHEDNEEAIKK